MTKPIYWIAKDETWCNDCNENVENHLETLDGEWKARPVFIGNNAESDTPHSCAGCGEFLENPLTNDGVAYVADALETHENGRGKAEVLIGWAKTYEDDLKEHPQVISC